MKRYVALRMALLLSCLASSAHPARAAIVANGNVEPANPSTWTKATVARIGNSASGTVTVTSGSFLRSAYGYIGYNGGVTGIVKIFGSGSGWLNDLDLYVGRSGNGVMNISK